MALPGLKSRRKIKKEQMRRVKDFLVANYEHEEAAEVEKSVVLQHVNRACSLDCNIITIGIAVGNVFFSNEGLDRRKRASRRKAGGKRPVFFKGIRLKNDNAKRTLQVRSLEESQRLCENFVRAENEKRMNELRAENERLLNERSSSRCSSQMNELVRQSTRANSSQNQETNSQLKCCSSLRTDPMLPELIRASQLIENSNRIVVVAGAGLSTSSGIPDFRSPNGIFASPILSKYKISNGELVFTLSYFQSRPEPLYELCRDLIVGDYQPTDGHRFISYLNGRNKLLRMYTQNIDCLEEGCIENAGEKVIFAHGKMRDDFLCSGCAKKSPYAEIKHWLGQQEESSAVPKCNDCGSPLRPNIVFYEEDLPPAYYENIGADLEASDLLVVVGTSLNVNPIASDVVRHIRLTKKKTIILNLSRVKGHATLNGHFVAEKIDKSVNSLRHILDQQTGQASVSVAD